MGGSPNLVPSLFGSAVSSAGFLSAQRESQRRARDGDRVRSAYRGDPFSRIRFWLFLHGPHSVLLLLYVGVVIVTLFVLACLIPAFKGVISPYLTADGGSNWTDDSHLQALSILGLMVAVVVLGLQWWEPRLAFGFLKHWAAGGEAERRLAARIKRQKAGLLRVDHHVCEHIATATAERLARDPDWLLGALIPPHADAATLANELMFGTMFETLMYSEFGGRWEKFVRIQQMRVEGGHALASPAAVLGTPPADYANEVRARFAPEVNLSGRLAKAVEHNAGVLRHSYSGSVTNLVQPSRPAAWPVVAVLCAIGCLALPWPRQIWLVLLAPQVGPTWSALIVDLVTIAAVLGLVLVVYRNLRGWTDAALRAARLATSFERVVHHLRELQVFRTYPVARVAFAKFLYEYGLLKCEEDELVLGQAKPIKLALLKTGAVWSDAVELEDDDDLDYFCDSAMRVIADELRSRFAGMIARDPATLARLGVTGLGDLKGEKNPYNMVDGFLYLLGSEFCEGNACENPQADCPLMGYGLCQGRKGYRLDRAAQQFVRDGG